MKRILLVLLILVLPILNGEAWATTFAVKNFAQLVAEADQIFVGTVSALESRKLPSGTIVTDVRFSNLQVLKGNNTGADIALLVLGGEVDGLRLELPGIPQFQVDARYLVFSRGNGTDMFPVVGGPAGIFRIMPGSPAESAVVVNASGMLLSSDVAADVRDSVPALTSNTSQSPLTLDLFISAIKARLGQ